MNWQTILEQIDAETARAFVSAARHVMDALLLEAERVAEAHGPMPLDYNTATLPADVPAGGWLSPTELRRTSQELTEAIAAEKWVDGCVCALRALSAIGGAL